MTAPTPPPPAPAPSDGESDGGRPAIAPIKGRPRSRPGEEAYLRSEMERAAIDIAAGW